MPIITRAAGGVVIATGQTTAYAPGDDGSFRKGTAKSYTVNNTGAYSGTTTIDVPAYAASTISFTAPNTVADSANGLAVVKTGDTVRIRGSGSNEIVDVVATGNVAGSFILTNGLVSNEVAGAFVTIAKRASHSNQTAFDNNVVIAGAKREWMSYTSSGEKVGPTSVGTMPWYDVAHAFTLHAAAADLQAIAPNVIRIVAGAGELARYYAGYRYQFSGFATAMNNLTGGWACTNVAVNGADLDLTVETYAFASLTSEAAAGSRAIAIVCNSIFAYVAACNVAAVSGKADWRVPNYNDIVSILGQGAGDSRPNGTAFPGVPLATNLWSTTTVTSQTTAVNNFQLQPGRPINSSRATASTALLLRGP